MLTDTTHSPYAKVHGMDREAVTLEDGFWKDYAKLCAEVTVPHLRSMFDCAEVSHVVENFKICAGESQGTHRGTPFGDGDFYKWMEAALYSAAYRHDEELFDELEDYIALISRAQRPDGYLSTQQIIEEMNGGGDSRLADINAFEVYNFGHLFTAACLHKRVTGRESFLAIAKRAAGYLKQLYDRAEESGQVQTAVCPSHYMGLVELYRTTGDETYRTLAKKALSLRDMVADGLDDNQDRLPLFDHDKIVGHAVRANYLYAGVADLYAETGTDWYLDVLHRVWDNLVEKKVYLTGGCGALYNGASPYGNFFKDQKVHQAYGYEYQLPNITAYNETCASVGGVMWAYRMFTVEPQARYMDMLERMMYNVNPAAISLDGKRFFYENALRRAKKLDYQLVWPLERTEYIKSYCCPPNLARLLSQAGEYFYTVSEDSVWTCLYGAGRVACCLKNGASFVMHQETGYPYDGTMRFTFDKVEREVPWKLYLRIPSWAESGRLAVNGGCRELTGSDRGTYLEVAVEHTEHTVVELTLDMPARITTANTMVEETGNHGAVERGPLVYCMESLDAASDVETLDDLLLPADARFETENYEIDGRCMTSLKSLFWCLNRTGYNRDCLYQTLRHDGKRPTPVRMVPYFAWDNRGVGEMRIWFPLAF